MKSDDKTRTKRRDGAKKLACPKCPKAAGDRKIIYFQGRSRFRLQKHLEEVHGFEGNATPGGRRRLREKRTKAHEQMLKEQTKLRDEVIPGLEQTLAANEISIPAKVPATLRERAEILGRAVKEKSFDFLDEEAE